MLVAALGCGHKPPYALGAQPDTATLVASTQAQLDAVAIPNASITLNSVIRGDLALVAQQPGRFRGSVTRVGKEFVTLAFTEDGYALRYLHDAMPTGYYSGPADPCAVEAMLGVPFSYEGLVALVLGGAPVIEQPFQVVKQKWSRREKLETLTLRNSRFVQDLRFAWVGGAWRFAQAELWEVKANGDKGAWRWSLAQSRHKTVGTAVLPGRTRIVAPGARKAKTRIVIDYDDRVVNPPWSKEAAMETDAADTGGPDWGDDDDDEGWENEEEQQQVPSANTTTAPPPELTEPPPPSAKGELASIVRAAVSAPVVRQGEGSPVTSVIPFVFAIDGAGLVDRGDLCRRSP